MKIASSMMMAGAALLIAPAALAQTGTTTAPAGTQTAPSAQTAPGAPAAGTTATTPAAPAASGGAVTEAEVTQFASAALAVEKIRKDTTVAEADKNAKMVEAITSSGLPATRFNEIAQAMQADPALNKRIQTAAAAQTKPAGTQ